MYNHVQLINVDNSREPYKRSVSVQFVVPSKRRLPMCRMAASSLEISQFSVSVNMRTFMADRMLE